MASSDEFNAIINVAVIATNVRVKRLLIVIKKELSLNLVVIIFEFILCFLTAKLGIISRNSMNNYEQKTIS